MHVLPTLRSCNSETICMFPFSSKSCCLAYITRHNCSTQSSVCIYVVPAALYTVLRDVKYSSRAIWVIYANTLPNDLNVLLCLVMYVPLWVREVLHGIHCVHHAIACIWRGVRGQLPIITRKDAENWSKISLESGANYPRMGMLIILWDRRSSVAICIAAGHSVRVKNRLTRYNTQFLI